MKGIRCIFFILSILTFQSGWANINQYSPFGYWKTIDDVTGQPKAIVLLSESVDHKLSGQIIKIFPRPGFDQKELCTACTGNKHNQRIVGMTIIDNLTQDKKQLNEWKGGDILDPHNGKTYHCLIQVMDNGKKMNVRGYIGFPLFGRSQTWMRVDHSGNA